MPYRLPRVSLGVPVYNAANYLAEALDCALAQTFEDWELIVADNASTDETQSICETYVARDPRIRYVRAAQNCGAARNFNRAFELAQGEFFKWAAHDDLFAPTFLERCVAALDAAPEAVYCHTRRADFYSPREAPVAQALGFEADPEQPWAPSAFAPERPFPLLCRTGRPADRFGCVLLAENALFDIYGLVRRAAMARTQLHGAYYGADRVFMLELALRGPFVQVDELLFFVRRHPQQSVFIGSAGAQEQWIRGWQRPRFVCPRRVRMLAGYCEAIRRADLSLAEKSRCLGQVAKFCANPGKWKRLGIDLARRCGLRLRVPEDVIQPPPSTPQFSDAPPPVAAR